jgi:riboflavin kinase/FMN adenylyltransferase
MEFSGTVGQGRGFGRTIGFPTINIPLTDKSVSGIYAATVVLDGESFKAAAYADQERGLLEAHILDWAGDCYGKEVAIALGRKIRDAAAFPDEIALMTAIAADVAQIRKELEN